MKNGVSLDSLKTLVLKDSGFPGDSKLRLMFLGSKGNFSMSLGNLLPCQFVTGFKYFHQEGQQKRLSTQKP